MKTVSLNILATKAIFIALTVMPAFGAPTITGVSGTIAQGSTITITGTGFGVKDPAPPLKWDNFETGIIGTDLGNGWYKENRHGGPYPRYTNDVVRPGSLVSLKQDYTYEEAGTGRKQDNNLFGLTGLSSTKYYVSFNRYVTVSGEASRNFKPFALRGGPAGNWDAPRARHDIYPMHTESGHLTTEDCNAAETSNNWNGADIFPINTWNRFEYYIDHGDPSTANGTYNFYMDNVLRTSTTNTILRTGSCTWTNMYFAGYFSRDTVGGAWNSAAAYIWNDDMYIDITQARIELSNMPTWNSVAHREIQIPITWSNNSITVKINQSTFSSLNGTYLYIIDQNGMANQQGYPLCPSCPRPPRPASIR